MQASIPKSLNVEKVDDLKKTAKGRLYPKKMVHKHSRKVLYRYSVTTLIPSVNLETTISK